jgi:heme O synthase-like polyprenyltransferase
VYILSKYTNSVTARLTLLNIILYAGVRLSILALAVIDLVYVHLQIYTPLKKITSLNTWIGAFVGAIPPLIGCSSS